MNTFRKIIVIFFTLKVCMAPFSAIVQAQDWTSIVLENQHRVDLRDLGYPDVNEIPINSTAITSLITARNGIIYGATSGEQAYLFIFDPKINKVRHLGKIPGYSGVHHALAEDKDGNIYIGTGINMFEKFPLSKWGKGNEILDEVLWKDIKKHFSNYLGGHLFRYNPKENNEKVKLSDMDCELEDLGMPLANNSVYALTVNEEGTVIYGITYPNGLFFMYDIKSGELTGLGETDSEKVYQGPERRWRTLSRALICDETGRVFFSGNRGKINYYDAGKAELVSTSVEIPGDYFYIEGVKSYTAVEYFAKAENGLIYGGTIDGYLFSFDTEKMELTNLGKVRASRRLRCLTVGGDGNVYIMAGERSASRPCQFYKYNTKSHGFENLGMLVVDRSPYYYWRGQQFDSMTTGLDGTIYIGESEIMSHLFLFIP